MTGLSEAHAKILTEERGLDVELLVRLGVESFPKGDGGEQWIRIPYRRGDRVVNWKYRTIAGEKRFYQERDAEKCFWNEDAIGDMDGEPLVITEGEFDAMAAIQAGFPRAISVPDGAPDQEQGAEDRGVKYSYMAAAKKALSDVRPIILCTDSDGPGVALMNDLAVRLGRGRCRWAKYPKGCKDLNDALVRYGVRGVRETIERAQWMQVDGVYKLSNLPPVPPATPHRIGILDDHFRIRVGDFSCFTGIPSHGKTTLVNEICCRMAERYGWGVAIASFEQHPQTDHLRALRTFRNKKLVINQTQEEICEADAWVEKHFSFVLPNEDDDVTLEWTLDKMATAIIRDDARLVVIDPWNEMDHVKPADMSLTEYTGFAIKQFRKLARKYRVHVIVVAHPTKQRKLDDGTFAVPTLYDISDSAHWYNKCDAGLIVHRMNESRTLIRVAKTRHHDEIGTPGDVNAMFLRHMARYEIIEPEAA